MQIRHLSFAVVLTLMLNQPSLIYAANRTPRTCGSTYSSILDQNSVTSSGIGGTGHETTIAPGGIGGTGHENAIPPGGIGGSGHNTNMELSDSSGIAGTGHESNIPPGGIGGTGHENAIPPGGIGGSGHNTNMELSDSSGIAGTGHESNIPSGGIGGTGHQPQTAPRGIGGTGIIAAGNMVNVNGVVTVENLNKQIVQLANGDEICVGDKITTSTDAKAQIVFTDGATLYVLKNSEISLIDYNYSTKQPELSRNTMKIAKGDIRSVSGNISKINPKQYSFSTPVSTIHVIGTDFLITHLTEQEGALDAGTYTKVITGEINVQSSSSSIRLRAGESSHVMLNGTQSVISSSGGTCMAPP